MRKLPGGAVRLDRGAIFCGYASGATSTDPNQTSGKSVGFRLTSASQLVVFDGEVVQLRKVSRCKISSWVNYCQATNGFIYPHDSQSRLAV